MSTCRTHRSALYGIAVALVLAIGTAGAQQTEERSTDPSTARSFGAIAYGEGGGRYSSGWSRNYATQDEADEKAVAECGRDPCKVVMRFWGRFCGAVARGENGAWGSASAATEYEARSKAARTCREYGGKGCEVLAVACNSD